MNQNIEIARTRRPNAGLMLAAAAATLVTIGLALAPAATAAELPTQRVQVSDLNLASATGLRTLERRIRIAIDKVCAPATSTLQSHAHTRPHVEACRRSAWEEVRSQLTARGMPPLLASHSR